MTPEEIAKAKVLCEAATPGPWEDQSTCIAQDVAPWATVVGLEDRGAPYMRYDELVIAPQDAAFIAEARTLLPKALEALEIARDASLAKSGALKAYIDENARLRAALEWYADMLPDHDFGKRAREALGREGT
jgi:hypothetical protein